MRNLLFGVGLAALMGCCSAEAASLPTPQFSAITVGGSATLNGTLSVTGVSTLTGGGQLSGTFTGPTALSQVTPSLTNVTISQLAGLAAPRTGTMVFATDCLNGAQVGAGGTGCPYYYNDIGQWIAMPSPPALGITIGGQAVTLGGSTTNQGNGAKIQLATGSFVVGHAPAYDNNGNLVDSGVVPSGGTGGGGTVAGAPQNSIPFYTNAGTASTIGGMTIVNNAIVVTSGSGVPSESTTAPTGLTIPSALITNGTLTGVTTIGAATHTGTLTLPASSVGAASLTIPPGVAPTSPVNGNTWETSVGLFSRVNGVTQGPYIGAATASGPITIGGIGTASLNFACATCATTTNGGLLAATPPLTISAAGLIVLGLQPSPLTWEADAATVVHNDTYPLIQPWPFTLPGSVKSVTYHTGGATSPSFSASIQVNGVNVASCNNLSVTSPTDTTATCGTNSIASGQALSLVITGTTGQPSSSLVTVVVNKPAS